MRSKRQGKPSWMKTDLPLDIKTKYHYRALIGTGIYPAWQQRMAKFSWPKEEEKYFKVSRDIYKNLINELKNMPENVFNSLLSEIQVWHIDMRNPVPKQGQAEHEATTDVFSSPTNLGNTRKERTRSTLSFVRAILLEWLYKYAHEISGELQDDFYSGWWHTDDFEKQVPLFEDIFGIAVTQNGRQIRGSGKNTDNIISGYIIDVQNLNSACLKKHGRNTISLIEKRIKTQPGLLDNISQEAAEIINLGDFMNLIVEMLDKWEKENNAKDIYDMDGSNKNSAERSNLRTLGRKALDIVIAIDKELSH
jgi:hypothetical protein